MNSCPSTDVKFADTGILRKSNYCVAINVHDPLYIYEPPANKSVQLCLTANMDLIRDAKDPIPERLTAPPSAPRQERKRNGTGSENVINSKDMAVRRIVQKLNFPSVVNVYRTAQNFSRIVEPQNMTAISTINIKFR